MKSSAWRQRIAPSSRGGPFSWLSRREHAPEASAKCLTSEKYSVVLYQIKYSKKRSSNTVNVWAVMAAKVIIPFKHEMSLSLPNRSRLICGIPQRTG